LTQSSKRNDNKGNDVQTCFRWEGFQEKALIKAPEVQQMLGCQRHLACPSPDGTQGIPTDLLLANDTPGKTM